MPLLTKAAPRVPKETLSVRLDPLLIERLDAYCEFIGNGRQDVIQSALTYIFDQDKDFITWAKERKSQQKPQQP